MGVRYRLFVNGSSKSDCFEDLEAMKQLSQPHIQAGARCVIEAFSSPSRAWSYYWDASAENWVQTGFPKDC